MIINARAETAAEKPMFRTPLYEGRRVAIPTTGFFEWQHSGGRATQKFLFRLPQQSMLYLCGLYTMVKNAEGEKEARYVILTTVANESMSPYHDRMPVMIAPEEIDTWLLDPDSTHLLLRKQWMLSAQVA